MRYSGVFRPIKLTDYSLSNLHREKRYKDAVYLLYPSTLAKIGHINCGKRITQRLLTPIKPGHFLYGWIKLYQPG